MSGLRSVRVLAKSVRHYIIMVLRVIMMKVVAIYRRFFIAGYLHGDCSGGWKWKKHLPEQHGDHTRIVCISDTHGHHRLLELPDCDILVHSGDSFMGRKSSAGWDLIAFLKELLETGKVKKYIIMVGGNHDGRFQNDPDIAKKCHPIIWLDQSSITKDGITWYGSPHTIETRSQNKAWQVKRTELKGVWRKIPKEIDILITHQAPRSATCAKGCKFLSSKVLDTSPQLHIHGHLHDSYGVNFMGSTVSVNAASCRGHLHHPLYAPVVVDAPFEKWVLEKANKAASE